MEIKRLDATPYLMADEKVLYKVSAKPIRSKMVQSILCYVFALIALAGDSFLLAMTYALNNDLKNVNTFLMPLEICLMVIHIIPFVFWITNVWHSAKNKGGKWYAITNKRVLTIEGSKPVTVSIINIEEITALRVGKDVVSLSLGEELVSLGGLADPKAFGDKILGLFGDAKSEEVSAKPATEKKPEEAVAPQVEEPSGEPEVIIAEVGKTPEENALVEEASNGENKDGE